MPATWEARVAEGRATRAEELAAQGDLAAARTEALAALDQARKAAFPPASARAQLLLGQLDRDRQRLIEALQLFEGLHDETGAAAARLDLAEAAVDRRQPDEALAWLAPAAARIDATDGIATPADGGVTAVAAARVHHLQAAALRLAGRPAEAAARERRAQLALSLVADTGELELRIEVAQALGDDYASVAEFQLALEQHARAASLARRDGRRPAELAAIAALSNDLAGLGRLSDATAHCSRAVALATALEDRDQARALGRQGLHWLALLREPRDSARWIAFDAAVRDAAR